MLYSLQKGKMKAWGMRWVVAARRLSARHHRWGPSPSPLLGLQPPWLLQYQLLQSLGILHLLQRLEISEQEVVPGVPLQLYYMVDHPGFQHPHRIEYQRDPD